MEKTVQFSTSAKPLIRSGIYNVNVSQVLEPDCKVEGFKVEEGSIKIAFASDQISMNKSEVYSVYPPENSVGDFTCCLPHVVFHRKTLPWEKQLKTTAGVDFTELPYIALLVVSDKEGVEEKAVSYAESKNTSVNVYRPEIDDELISDDQACTVVEIPIKLWVDILPYAEDLPYIAHTKCIDLDNKVTDSEVKGEWFSCIISNRYPDALEMGQKNLKHTVYLVSLEGFEDYLVLSQEDRINKCTYDYIRMYSLYSYSFYIEPVAYDFYSLASTMKAGTLQAEANESCSDTLQNIMQLGYVPMNHSFREGSRMVSWYRSPFLPGEIPYKENITYDFCSDQLLHYDPEQGMFDITYSAAWQIGRMLGLQNIDFAGNILAWRLYNKQEGVKHQNYKMFKSLISENAEGNSNTVCNDNCNELSYKSSDSTNDNSNVSINDASTSMHSLSKNVFHRTIKSLHEGCKHVGDPTGLRGTKVEAFSKEKAIRVAAKNTGAISQADLLEEDRRG